MASMSPGTALFHPMILITIDRPRHRPEHDGTVEQRQAQIFQTQLSSAELAHQEALIQERETEIREIETGIHELHEIFRDLGTIVQGQGEMLGSRLTLNSISWLTTTHHPRQHREQHLFDRRRRFRGSRGTFHSSRVSAKGRAEGGVPRGRPRCRCPYRSSGCACRHMVPLFVPGERPNSPTAFPSHADPVIVM